MPSRPRSAASSTAPSRSRSDQCPDQCPDQRPGQSPDRSPGRNPDLGSATVETALVIPVLVLLALALCGIVSALATQIRCIDAARLGARAAARGETADAVQTAVSAAAPTGTRTTFATGGGLVRVAVSAPVSGLPLLQMFTVHAEAEAADENDDTSAGTTADHTDPVRPNPPDDAPASPPS